MNAWRTHGLWRYVIVAAIAANTALGAGYWSTHDGYATRNGVDDWTFVNTKVYAQLNYRNGLAAEMEVTNFDSKNPIYISGVGIGTNQYNAGTSRTGAEVAPGKTARFPITAYQTKAMPLESMPFTYQYMKEYETHGTKAEKDQKQTEVDLRNQDRKSAFFAFSRAVDRHKALEIQYKKFSRYYSGLNEPTDADVSRLRQLRQLVADAAADVERTQERMFALSGNHREHPSATNSGADSWVDPNSGVTATDVTPHYQRSEE